MNIVTVLVSIISLLPLSCFGSSGLYYPNAMNSNILYVSLLFLSSCIFLYLRSALKTKVAEIYFWIHFCIVTWSALMYMNLIFDTVIKPYTWYADWIISTPLIMLALGLTAMYPLQKINYALLFGLLSTQVMIIATGYLAHICPTDTGKLTFFIVGNVLMLLLFYLVAGPLRAISAQTPAMKQKFSNLTVLLLIFWISYPVAWIIGTPGYGLISPFATNVLFVVLPILCKPVFGLLDIYLLKQVYEESL